MDTMYLDSKNIDDWKNFYDTVSRDCYLLFAMHISEVEITVAQYLWELLFHSERYTLKKDTIIAE